ncbi:HAMP domain-containing histidine kinase [Massilia sp. PAMC28688]|uniref:sensor histidine kinase n=1 Tax=Massilia sp. PAMC28688 TaxID=2861283 RepID=UPI001C6269F9|nr:HAMP domain-containing sensor histidine kinase [Massilia sp. PAMC28688]QYF92074.1 HAMP domain-containing histidine kinase [Massilia sp. PAMC28688]
MISIALPDDTLTDWNSWRTPLDQFAQASGLTVCAYDIQCGRQVGPFMTSRTSRLLESGLFWKDDGAATALERRLVVSVLASDQPAQDSICGMRVYAIPLKLLGQVYGVVTFGWVFADFSSPMECEQLALKAGVSGQRLWNEVRLQPPVSQARMQTYTALLHTLVDTIDRQRETIGELSRVNRTRDLFLATVSHEMRTPLSALSMRVELLLKTHADLPEPVESALRAMRVHVRQEAAMIDDLIDAARTLTGQMSIERTALSLGRVVRDAVSTIEGHAHEKAILFTITPADRGDSITLAADGRRLQQVLWNLLLNAIKFTPAGGSLRLAIARGATHVEIAVIDSGQGIAAPDIHHVFGAFTLQTEGNATGLGLGLYIARRIVELHGGTLTVTSPGRDQGSTFTIRLPLT